MLQGTCDLMKQSDLEGLARALRSMTSRTACTSLCLYTKHHKLIKGDPAYWRVTCTEEGVLSDAVVARPSLVMELFEAPRVLNESDVRKAHGYNPKVDRPMGVTQASGAMLAVPITDRNDGVASAVLVQYDKMTGGAFDE